jgi:hypothetical protein
MIVDNDLGFVR